MAFGDDIETQAEAQAGAFAGWFGGKKGLENLSLQLHRDTVAIVFHAQFKPVGLLTCNEPDGWKIAGWVGFGLFTNGVKSIVKQV